jgi:hypothetical protein
MKEETTDRLESLFAALAQTDKVVNVDVNRREGFLWWACVGAVGNGCSGSGDWCWDLGEYLGTRKRLCNIIQAVTGWAPVLGQTIIS